jgi:threonylcarbamoyladenosine tRNA methylthiotransferase MtaB
VMAGFPGETEKQFANTYQLIDRLPLTYLHAFPFSPRPGTPAASMPGRVHSQELKRRVHILRDLSRQKKLAFQAGLLGQSVHVLAETRLDGGCWRGPSENYLQVAFPAQNSFLPGFVAEVKLQEITEKGLQGKPVALPLQK